MNRDDHILNSLKSITVGLKAAELILNLQGKEITKVNYTGNDLFLTLDNGRQVIISAMELNGKPYLETESSLIPVKPVKA